MRYMIVYVLYATDIKSDTGIRGHGKKMQNVPSERLIDVPLVDIGIDVDMAHSTRFTTMARATTRKP